jgi:molybdopterin synthase sulfur carrier subunit
MIEPQLTRVMFFASLREAMKTGSLEIAQPKPLVVRELILIITRQSVHYQKTLSERDFLVAVNKQLVDFAAMVSPGDEVAIFPPVTGG